MTVRKRDVCLCVMSIVVAFASVGLLMRPDVVNLSMKEARTTRGGCWGPGTKACVLNLGSFCHQFTCNFNAQFVLVCPAGTPQQREKSPDYADAKTGYACGYYDKINGEPYPCWLDSPCVGCQAFGGGGFCTPMGPAAPANWQTPTYPGGNGCPGEDGCGGIGATQNLYGILAQSNGLF